MRLRMAMPAVRVCYPEPLGLAVSHRFIAIFWLKVILLQLLGWKK